MHDCIALCSVPRGVQRPVNNEVREQPNAPVRAARLGDQLHRRLRANIHGALRRTAERVLALEAALDSELRHLLPGPAHGHRGVRAVLRVAKGDEHAVRDHV